MSTQKQVQSLAEQCWRTLLTDGRKPLRVVQVLFRVLPAPPRCKKCYAPYRGVGEFTVHETGNSLTILLLMSACLSALSGAGLCLQSWCPDSSFLSSRS